jgi:hypothetical protein
MTPTFDMRTLIIVGLVGIILGMLTMVGNQVRIRIEEPQHSDDETPFGALGGCLGALVLVVGIGFAVYLIMHTVR